MHIQYASCFHKTNQKIKLNRTLAGDIGGYSENKTLKELKLLTWYMKVPLISLTINSITSQRAHWIFSQHVKSFFFTTGQNLPSMSTQRPLVMFLPYHLTHTNIHKQICTLFSLTKLVVLMSHTFQFFSSSKILLSRSIFLTSKYRRGLGMANYNPQAISSIIPIFVWPLKLRMFSPFLSGWKTVICKIMKFKGQCW